MRAFIPDGHGSVLLAEVADPEPTAQEVVVAVEAYSVNRGETFQLEEPEPGWRPGKDVAGIVVEQAADGTGPAVGQRVVAHPAHGGWAERVTVPVDGLSTVPDSVPAAIAAALPLAGLTALRLTRIIGSLAGRRVLLTGASGGVGHYLVELAAAQGAVITAVARTNDRGTRLLELGASDVVSEVDKTEGRYDIVLESVGGATFTHAWRRLTAHGLFMWMGQASRQPVVIDFHDWTAGASATLRKFNYADSEVSDREDLATLVRLVTSGHLHPEIGQVRPWHDTPEVLRALVDRQVRGNAVLRLGS